MLELGEEIEELIGAEKKTETRKRTTYKRISRKLKVKCKRSLANDEKRQRTIPQTL